jgi:glycosyltransferase involved in cell wall biosynthesis
MNLMTREYVGFLDTVKANRFIGWARNTRTNEAVKIVAVVGGDVIRTVVSNNFRKDLLDAGEGEGKFGFDFSISHQIYKHAIASQQSVSLFIEEINGVLIDEIFIYHDFLNENAKSRYTVSVIDYIYEYLDADNELNTERHLPVGSFNYTDKLKQLTTLMSKLYEPVVTVTSNKYQYQKKPSVSAYLNFIRHRSCLNKKFIIENNVVDIDNYLLWYIETYHVQNKNVKPPFSAAELEYLNELLVLPGCQFQFTRLHFFLLLKHNSDINIYGMLNDLVQYKNEVFEWVLNSSINLNVEDCLIPQSYKNLMASVDQDWRNRAYPLTVQSVIYFNTNQYLDYLHLSNELDRKIYFTILMLKAIEKPILLNAIPIMVLTDFLEVKDNKLNGFQQLILDNTECEELIGKKINEFSKENYAKKLLKRSFCLHSLSFTTLDKAGNRSEGNKYKPTKDNTEHEFDVQLIGPINKASGLGQATRLSADILFKTGLKVNVVDFGFENPCKEGFNTAKNTGVLAKSKINLIHLNAELLPTLIAYYPDVFSNSYNVGYFYWELNSPAACHSLALELVDEIWVSSEYGVGQYQPYTDKPVTNVGMAYEKNDFVDKQLGKQYITNKYDIDNDEFIFLVTFDSFSYPERKNPIGAIKAFQAAFTSDEKVKLILKTHNRDFVVDKKQIAVWDEITHLMHNDKRIIVINETLKYEELLTLKSGCDCYVSLHRSEGWGFGVIEAMGLGVAVITTNYSGNLEFCNADNSWLVDYQLKYVNPEDYIFVRPGQQWADPTIKSATQAMLEAFYNPKLREQKSQSAKISAINDFSVDSIVIRYINRLNKILTLSH